MQAIRWVLVGSLFAAGYAAFSGSLAVATSLTDRSPIASPSEPIRNRNVGVSREGANKLPRSENDQTLTDDWPLYRNERGQQAFNEAMATLKATDGSPAPPANAFDRCPRLACNLALPTMSGDGWIPAGRLWVTPGEYVLFVRTPRLAEGRSYARNARRDMRYFVFHEFHNSSRNIDAYDTLASHRGSVFVPFYMSKQATDARGRRFVVVLQVAPYDVDSIHASNYGSAGPGIEVAKNSADDLQQLQSLAGILVATIVKAAAPQLRVVNHRGEEGLAMLEAYDSRLEKLGERGGGARIALPFVAAAEPRIAVASGPLQDLIKRPGLPARTPVAERTIVPPKPKLLWQR